MNRSIFSREDITGMREVMRAAASQTDGDPSPIHRTDAILPLFEVRFVTQKEFDVTFPAFAKTRDGLSEAP